MHAARQPAMLCRKLAVCPRASAGTHARLTHPEGMFAMTAAAAETPAPPPIPEPEPPVPGPDPWPEPDDRPTPCRRPPDAHAARGRGRLRRARRRHRGSTISSNLGTFLSITLGGTAFVLLLAAAFYAVGRSEDRARARDEQQQR